MSLLVSEEKDFKIKTVIRDKVEHFIMIKRSIQKEDMAIENIYAPNRGAPKHIKQSVTDIKRETDNNTITVGDFNIRLHQ